ncbi:MAG TPA: YkgJ family cysteine cluster protein, partial [Gemmataceae bacterium]
MALPVRSLPVIQNWDCHGCADCCREYLVRVTDEERARIEAQGWEDDPALRGVRLFTRKGWRRPRYHLNRRADGACVFLDENHRCRIHARFGAGAKPLACRIYPFVLVPAGDHWRVGLRYACPSAAGNKGRPLGEHLPEVRDYAAGLERQEGIGPGRLPGPPTHRGQSCNWPDFFRFIAAFGAVMRDTSDPLERRLRRWLALAKVCREARFDRITGPRLTEFLEVMTAAVGEEVPERPEDVAPPGWLGRLVFRQALALYVRKDTGPQRGISRRGRLALLWSAWRFARGTGRVPRLHAAIPEVRFEQAEEPAGPIPPAVEERLANYYRLKLESLQFCGKSNFGLPVWDGLASLALTFPAVCWLARVLRDRPREEALVTALRIVDDNFGFNPMLGTGRQKFAVRLLAERQEADRLVAWYA